MPWLKSDDDMPNNDKIWPLTDACYRLYEASRFYAARKLTDGHVPTERISSLTPKPATKPQVEALVRARLWHRLPGLTCKSCIASREKKGAGPMPHSGYLVHDFLEFNPTRSQWERDEAQRKEAGRLGGLEKGRRRSGSLSEPLSDPLSDAPSAPLAKSAVSASEPLSEMPSGAPSPYPVSRTPSSGAIAPVPAEPEIPDAPQGADRSRDQAREGRESELRHAGPAFERVAARVRRRAAS